MHRDVKLANVVVGFDGVARVIDFGIAKAVGGSRSRARGSEKGRSPNMAPEQMSGGPGHCRSDVYAAAVCAWELLTGARLFEADTEGGIVAALLRGEVLPPAHALSAASRGRRRGDARTGARP